VIALLLAAAACPSESFRYLDASLREHPVHYTAKRSKIEYCPDETCEIFAARKHASCEELSDFLLLYVRYFSDYAYLDDSPSWRSRPETAGAVAKVLAKPPYAACPRENPAVCVLSAARKRYGLIAYFSRFDEGANHVGRVRFQEIKPFKPWQ
jgi:hypothetical protein